MRFDQPPVVRVARGPERPLDPGQWLMTVPAVAQLVPEGALPGATIVEVGDWGLRHTTWSELELVQHWKSHLDAPGRYLRHLVDD